MPGILDQCEEFFGSRDIYIIFQITKDANEKDVKKAYHKLSLKFHPDRVSEDEKIEATEKFKVLAKIYEVLSDQNKRSLYDESGIVDEDGDINLLSWLELWRTLFKTITEEDIDKYMQEYIGSEVEREDIKKAYLNHKGCINKMSDCIQFMDADNEPRIIDIVKEMIAANEVPEYEIFTNEPVAKRNKRHKKYVKEEKEAKKIQEKREKENKASGLSLEQQIMKRQSERGSGFAALFAKYGSRERDDENDEVLELKDLGKIAKKNKKSVKKSVNPDHKSKDRKVKTGRVQKADP